ncbi:EscU/YscU/HrcU family type III secretion system export apparatus switch protein [Luminiphilus sp.]|nr:EscU/YscU/HrcU family type III secretion system export apparatus switch protein [Luminiphilus sp.]
MTDRFTSKSAALSYAGDGAPRLVAKGEGELAEKIKAIADELDIPIVEQAGLVELLCQIPLGDEIPPALYVAVAEVLAHVFRLNNRVDELT